MNAYVNRFFLTMNNYRDEVVLSFLQEAPIFTEVEQLPESNVTSVADLVMSSRSAREFAEKLLEMLDSELPEQIESK